MTREEKFMQEAIDLSLHGITNNEGGPFGCVIVQGDKIIGRGNNKVTSTNDPTAHAEIVAIRDACKNIGSFQLEGCEVYTSCEPCPMCLGAIYWARPKVIYFANNREDAAAIGFARRPSRGAVRGSGTTQRARSAEPRQYRRAPRAAESTFQHGRAAPLAPHPRPDAGPW